MAIWRNFLKRCVPWRVKLWVKSRLDPELATPRDLDYCYRLYLGRQPDKAGRQAFMASIRQGAMTVSRLARSFRESEEYRRRLATQREAGREGILVRLEPFSIYVADTESAIGHAIGVDGEYEPEVAAAFRRHLEPGMTVVDVGCNVGYFSLLAAALVGAEGRVYAFDPNPRFCDLLRRSAASNGFKNIEVHGTALADRPSEQTYIEVEGSGMLTNRAVETGDELARRVTTSTLDRALGPDVSPHLIKMDVEGAEPLVIAGAREMLARSHPLILTELAPRAMASLSGVDAADYLRELTERGYELHVLRKQDSPLSCGSRVEKVIAEWERRRCDHIDVLLTPRLGG